MHTAIKCCRAMPWLNLQFRTAWKHNIKEKTAILKKSEPLDTFFSALDIKKEEAMQFITSLDTQKYTHIKDIDDKAASLICTYYGIPYSYQHSNSLVERAPIVTIMGHVDHGKTSLLDTLRNSNICDNEYGHITQSIGAFTVKTKKGPITFIDTPGHEGFTTLRRRGAEITDIIILVISIVDGLQQQTLECLNIAKSSKIPFIVAFNKMDRVDDTTEIEEGLINEGIDIDTVGGAVPSVKISATKKMNIDLLLSKVSDMWNKVKYSEDTTCLPQCFVIESIIKEEENNKSNSCSASVIVQRGLLKEGQPFICGFANGKVKDMMDDRGNQIECGYPGQAVLFSGFRNYPAPGQILFGVSDIKMSQFIIDYKKRKEIDCDIPNVEKVKFSFNKKERKALGKGITSMLYEKLDLENNNVTQVKYKERRLNPKYVPNKHIKPDGKTIFNKESDDYKFLKEVLMAPRTRSVIIKSSSAGTLEIIMNEVLENIKSTGDQC